MDLGPHRDLVGELSAAVRKRQVGQWWGSSFRFIQLDLFFRPNSFINDPWFLRNAGETVERTHDL